MTNYPKRRIFRGHLHAPLMRKGERGLVILECGHYDRLTKTEARQKWHTCFDCFYGKPAQVDIEQARREEEERAQWIADRQAA